MFVPKQCGKCLTELPLEAFNRYTRSLDGRQHWCRECFREYFRQRGDFHRRQSAEAKARRVAITYGHLLEHLSTHSCLDCGEADLRVLEFDHVDAKQAEVSGLARDGVWLELLEIEIDRCEVVCANCHRRRTATRAGWVRAGAQLSLSALARPRRWRNAEWVYERLAKESCVDCGLAEPLLLEYDHVGKKKGGVMQLAWQEYGLETLEREISQCEVRCCNCHRRRTLERINARRVRALQSL